MALPPRVRLLDPRPTDVARAAPILDAAHIPLAELARRIGELPPTSEPVLVADLEPWATEAVAFLEHGDRKAIRVPAFLGEAGRGRLWEPNAFLLECAALLTAGDALDLGCGIGRDAVALAALGWRVTAVDVLPDAIARGRELAERYAPGTAIEWAVTDLEDGSPPSLLNGRDFDLIVSIRYLNRPLLDMVGRWLRPGGHLLVETFTVENRRVHGRPRRDAHALKLGELPGLVSELSIVRYDEGWHDGFHTARLLAQRPIV